MKEEISVVGTVSAAVWIKLFTSGYGWIGLLLCIFSLLLGEAVYDASNQWLSEWSSESPGDQRQTHYPYVYLGLVVGRMDYCNDSC